MSLLLLLLLLLERNEFFDAYTEKIVCLGLYGCNNGHLITTFRRAMTSKEKTLAKNASWLSLENAKLKVKLLKNQVRANQLTVCFCDIRIFVIFESHYELGG